MLVPLVSTVPTVCLGHLRAIAADPTRNMRAKVTYRRSSFDGGERVAGFERNRGMSKRLQLGEVVFFLLIVVPLVGIALSALEPPVVTFADVVLSTGLQDLVLLAVVLLFLRRNSEPLKVIGWSLHNGWKETAVGVGLFLPLPFVANGIAEALQGLGLGVAEPEGSMLLPDSTGDYALALVFLVVVAVSEEVLFRGYLLRRFRAITGSWWVAVVMSSAIFALGHGYEGLAGAITVGVVGAWFAVVYLWRGTLMAPIVMHFLQNFVSLLVLPAFAMT
jgi:membrane protease YdiL (CAAX protease family)